MVWIWFLVGCGNSEKMPEVSAAECAGMVDLDGPAWGHADVVHGTVRSFNAENLGCYLAAFHPSLQTPEFRDETAEKFAQYDVTVSVVIPALTMIREDEFSVMLTQQTRSNEPNSEYEDIEATVTHRFEEVDGRFRITGTTLADVKKLN